MMDIRVYSGKALRMAVMSCLTLSLVACNDIRPAPLVVVTAQPKTPAQRNLTPFYPALRCMDDLFLKAGRRNVLLSSNQIPDRTRGISVDSRSMIITALNHMTRRSKAFTFIEQGIVGRTSGDTLYLEKDDKKGGTPKRPTFYFSGSISQLDSGVQDRNVEVTTDFEASDGAGLTSAAVPNTLQSSIVTLDLHLVSFPSRVVVPGTAVSNSMVVSKKVWTSGFVGKISQRTLGLEFEVDSIESQGQAVRSLIELGLIEMLGTYSGVPFWECLSNPDVHNAYKTALEERGHAWGMDPDRLQKAQVVLAALGYVEVQATGKMDAQTRSALSRFQAQQGLLVNGKLDFDTYQALEKAHAAMAPKPVAQKPVRKPTPASQPQRRDDGFKSLGSFVGPAF